MLKRRWCLGHLSNECRIVQSETLKCAILALRVNTTEGRCPTIGPSKAIWALQWTTDEQVSMKSRRDMKARQKQEMENFVLAFFFEQLQL